MRVDVPEPREIDEREGREEAEHDRARSRQRAALGRDVRDQEQDRRDVVEPDLAGDVPVHLLEGGDEQGGEEEPRHDPLLGARHGDGAAGGERGGGHARLLSRSASSSTRPPRARRLRHSSESGVPSRLPACQRRWRSSSASRKCVHVVGWNHDAGSRVAHELRGRAVGRDGGEDRPLGREVLEDLPGQDAPAAAARLRDQEEQRLGVPLQLERAAARDVAEQLDAVAETERLGVLAVGGAEVAGEAGDDVVEAGVRECAQERLRVALAVEVARVRDPEAVARVVLEAREVVEVGAVRDRDDLALRLQRTHLLGDRVGHRDDRVRLRGDEPPHPAGGLLLQPRELRLVAAPMRMRGERVAEVGDPRSAGRPLHRGAEQVERRRRRGREHDVDPLAPDEPDGDRQRERAPRDVLVRDEQAPPEQRCLRADPCDALLADELLRGTSRARPDVAHAVDPRLRRQLELLVRDGPGDVRSEHVRLDPERREVRRELERPLDAAPAARREVARHEQDLQRSVTGATVLTRRAVEVRSRRARPSDADRRRRLRRHG